MAMAAATENLRFALRGVTAQAHDMLDATMQEAAGWRELADYERFLCLQYTARRPVEAWLDHHAPDGCTPPAQSPRIAEDLAAMGVALPQPSSGFALVSPATGSALKSTALGAAWVLAGSSLGNRAILAEIRKNVPDGRQWPHAFLGDEAMLTFWKSLRAQIERPAGADELHAASSAAAAVFDHFLRVAGAHTSPHAASRSVSAAAS